MADETKYIYVKFSGLTSSDDDEDKKEKKPKSSIATGLKGLQKAMHPIQTLTAHDKDEGTGVFFAKEIANKTIGSMESVVNYSVSRYFRLSEDYKSEYYLNNIMSNINRTKSFGMSVAGGGIAGSKFGPVGAVAGMAISGATNAFNQYISYQNQIASYEQSLNATRVETSFKAQRAGLYDGGKGTEN